MHVRRLALLLSLVGIALAPARPATAAELIADISQRLVAITTGFTGADVLLFGATEGKGDVIVIVRGPGSDVVVRQKERVAERGVAPAYHRHFLPPVEGAVANRAS